MSMIGAQIDELRRAAQTYRDLGNYEIEQLLLDAADTIWQLRDDLQRTNDAVQDAEHDESRAWDCVRKVEAKNAKLRSICAEVEYILLNLDIDYCGLCDRDSINHPCPVHTGGECLIESELHKLKVEVD